MFDKFQQLREVKRQAEQLKKDLDSVRLESCDVPGVTIVINGTQSLQSIALTEELLGSADKSRIENELLRAVNAAVKKSQDFAAQKMKSLTALNL